MISSVLAAIVPIVSILLLGKLLSTLKIISDEGWLGLEGITYYALFPALIVSKLASAEFTDLDWRMPVSLIGAQLLLAGITIAAGKALNQPGERIGVFVQSSVRWNTFIALALAQELIGPTGLALVAAAAAALIPTANIISIVALTRFSNETVSATDLFKQVVTNPLIIALATGLTLNWLGIGLFQTVSDLLNILAQASIATGLLASGAYIQIRKGKVPLHSILTWSTLRLLGLPIAAGGMAVLLALPSTIIVAILIATAVPTASNGAILARQLGGDAALAANLIACQTMLSLLSFAAVLWTAQVLQLI